MKKEKIDGTILVVTSVILILGVLAIIPIQKAATTGHAQIVTYKIMPVDEYMPEMLPNPSYQQLKYLGDPYQQYLNENEIIPITEQPRPIENLRSTEVEKSVIPPEITERVSDKKYGGFDRNPKAVKTKTTDISGEESYLGIGDSGDCCFKSYMIINGEEIEREHCFSKMIHARRAELQLRQSAFIYKVTEPKCEEKGYV